MQNLHLIPAERHDNPTTSCRFFLFPFSHQHYETTYQPKILFLSYTKLSLSPCENHFSACPFSSILSYHTFLPTDAAMSEIPRVYFHSPKNSAYEFEITSLQELFTKQKRLLFPLEQPHRVHFYHLLIITKGSGQHHIDFTSYNVQEGDVLLIAPNQIHAFEITDHVEGIILLFTESFILKNINQTQFAAVNALFNYHTSSPLLQQAYTADIRNDIEALQTECRHPQNAISEEILRLQLNLLLLKLARKKYIVMQPIEHTEWKDTFAEFRKSLERGYTTTRNAADFAEQIGVSYKHLNAICKAIVGSTAKEFIDAYVVLEIKRHIAVHSPTTKELAIQTGFDEPTNLVKFFKRHTGQTPRMFMTKLKQQTL
ncbi:helix-turn-helix transcriptional regulator [Halodesulfovibrio sp.]|uniref:AraC family transcriptional regulator n=1 Tax=Halodesulfovibrio sp. TaxID=1912772 RepID=UPI0025C1E3E5|nr:helix-turn-helix transcriptional regulator [Halodesulfovibrio sp.]